MASVAVQLLALGLLLTGNAAAPVDDATVFVQGATAVKVHHSGSAPSQEGADGIKEEDIENLLKDEELDMEETKQETKAEEKAADQTPSQWELLDEDENTEKHSTEDGEDLLVQPQKKRRGPSKAKLAERAAKKAKREARIESEKRKNEAAVLNMMKQKKHQAAKDWQDQELEGAKKLCEDCTPIMHYKEVPPPKPVTHAKPEWMKGQYKVDFNSGPLAGLMGHYELHRFDCACLNWTEAYSQYEVSCGDGHEKDIANAIGGVDLCKNVFSKLEGSSCVPGHDEQTDDWCYVDDKCQELNGGHHILSTPMPLKKRAKLRYCALGDELLSETPPDVLAALAKHSKIHNLAQLAQVAYNSGTAAARENWETVSGYFYKGPSNDYGKAYGNRNNQLATEELGGSEGFKMRKEKEGHVLSSMALYLDKASRSDKSYFWGGKKPPYGITKGKQTWLIGSSNPLFGNQVKCVAECEK